MLTEESLDLALRAYFAGQTMDANKALNVAAFAAAVEFVSGVVSELPIKLFRRVRQRGENGERPTYATHELVDDRRVTLLNKSSGDIIRPAEMRKNFVADFYTRKGAFVYVNRVGNRVESLHYVDPGAVSILADETDHIFKRMMFSVDGRSYFPWQFVYAFRNSRTGFRGAPLVEQSPDVLGTAYNTQIFEKALMERGGNHRGFLQSERKINEKSLTELKKAFQRMYQGENSDNVIVLNDGVKFQEASETSQEMQLAENKERQRDDVLSLFLIPPSLISGGGDDDDHKKFVNYALMPLLKVIEDALNDALLLETEKRSCYFSFDLKELTKANLRDRWSAWATAKKNGLVNADEFRRFEDMEPLGMDYINLGLQDVLMEPNERKIIVPNMGTVIDLDNLTPPKPPNQPTGNAVDKTDKPDESQNDRDPEGGEQNGSENQ